MDVFLQIWMVVKWFFTDFFLQVITAPMGILKDLTDTIGLSWKIICLLGSILLLVVTCLIKYIKKWFL